MSDDVTWKYQDDGVRLQYGLPQVLVEDIAAMCAGRPEKFGQLIAAEQEERTVGENVRLGRSVCQMALPDMKALGRAIAGEKEEGTMRVEVGKRYAVVDVSTGQRDVGVARSFQGSPGSFIVSGWGVAADGTIGNTKTSEQWPYKLEEIDEPAHQQAVVTAETKRPAVGIWDDEPGELERLRRVFATWDFWNGA